MLIATCLAVPDNVISPSEINCLETISLGSKPEKSNNIPRLAIKDHVIKDLEPFHSNIKNKDVNITAPDHKRGAFIGLEIRKFTKIR